MYDIGILEVFLCLV